MEASRSLPLLLLILMPPGCASTGPTVSRARLDQLVVGQSSEVQVMGILGPPTSNWSAQDRKYLVYEKQTSLTMPWNFVPVLNFVAGHYWVTTTKAVCTLDAEGRLIDKTVVKSRRFRSAYPPGKQEKGDTR